jgi:2',3'-cyclic-nucleotide 2'-phosphodiesterase (5'-nucleotidase family)
MPPPALVAQEIKRRKAEGADIFILLSHLNPTETAEVAEKNPELHFILGGQEMKYRHGLTLHGQTLVAEAFMRGKNLSVLSLQIKDGSFRFVDRNYKSSLVKRVAALDNQIKTRSVYIENARKDPKKARSLEYFERNLVQLKTELQMTKMDLEDAREPDSNASQVSWELKGVDTSLADEKNIKELVTAYRKIYPDPTQKNKAAVKPSRPIGPRRTRTR